MHIHLCASGCYSEPVSSDNAQWQCYLHKTDVLPIHHISEDKMYSPGKDLEKGREHFCLANPSAKYHHIRDQCLIILAWVKQKQRKNTFPGFWKAPHSQCMNQTSQQVAFTCQEVCKWITKGMLEALYVLYNCKSATHTLLLWDSLVVCQGAPVL